MPHIVTLDVYSGTPNPTWVLNDRQASNLEKMLARRKAPAKKGGSLPLLGYRGFVVRPVESKHVQNRPLRGLVASHTTARDAVVSGIPDAEQFLLDTAGDSVDVELRRHVSERVAARHDRLSLEKAFGNIRRMGCPSCNAADAPAYNPAFWNIPARQPNNNCYNYANDQATNTFAQPGRASGHPATAMSCPAVTPAAASDGLGTTGGFGGALGAGKGWYVALVVWPGRDYHWYRQDKIGCWSHKPGSTAARNTDNAGAAISDPKTCDRGPYTDFCTYMITTRGVVIR